jgi:hypothetical protein
MTLNQSLLIAAWLLTASGCTLAGNRPLSSDLTQPVVPKFQRDVSDSIDQHLAAQQTATLNALSKAAALPVDFTRPRFRESLVDPWTGLAILERDGQRLADLARSGSQNLPEVIGTMETAMGRIGMAASEIPVPTEPDTELVVAYLLAVLQHAHELREQAIHNLSPADREFLFGHALSLVEHFSPQIPGTDEQAMARMEDDRRFIQLASQQLDYSRLITAAQGLAQLGNTQLLRMVAESFRHVKTGVPAPSGITGEVLMVRETPSGLIVIGGSGPNAYELDQRVALVIDLGGDDHYRGAIASPSTARQGISVVVDLWGHDRYEASPLGLATGRLGVGLLIDLDGDDQYELAQGTGGAGFAGLGMLIDMAGNDQYTGGRFTQGVAIGGLGLLADWSGHDTFTSFGYALGFGGPLGVGVVVDVDGDDLYQCGNHIPSQYNSSDGSDLKPGDPLFEYDCFGMGAGSGSRIFPAGKDQFMGVAGGLGILVDLAGSDHYRSANFSQGFGYFFGTGLKLDMAGNDEHAAARYGQAAAAHEGVGLFIDYRGRDHYTSTGPVYNGGAAWDRSVALCIDAGEGDDRYELSRSDGLGRADHASWSVFLDEAGSDRYVVPNGMGTAVNSSLSAFFDLSGEDDYAMVPKSSLAERRNGRRLVDPTGGLFEDR